VVPWLISCRFSPAELSIEFNFTLRLGRSLLKVGGDNALPKKAGAKFSPRADVLVRNESGENLLIIEVKSPNENIDDQARDQGISYARCVAEGNIAPYVVVTNGHITRVFNSITRQEFLGHSGLLASCLSRNLHVGPADLLLRAEALEALISFPPKNLIAFCDAQVRYRMKPLFGERIDSDKKYIPALFVQRDDVARRLSAALDDKTRRVTLLIGHPRLERQMSNAIREWRDCSKGGLAFFILQSASSAPSRQNIRGLRVGIFSRPRYSWSAGSKNKSSVASDARKAYDIYR